MREIDIETAAQLRDHLAGTPDERCVEGIFAACLQPVVYSRHHWLKYKGDYRVRADLRGELERLQATPPADWDAEESDLVLSLYALSISSVGLDELIDRVDSDAVRAVLRERGDAYQAALGGASGEPSAGLLSLARRVDALRRSVEVTHHLYSIIDGEAWYRTEGMVPRAAVRPWSLSPDLERVIEREDPDTARLAGEEKLREAARRCADRHGEAAPLLREIMALTLSDPVLRGDHVTLTCPNGDLLDTPERMTTSEAFFTETQLREAVDLSAHRDRLGHESSDQLQRNIRARMLKLKRGAIRGLYGPGCMRGRFVEKHGGHMIYRNEDSHYRGHQSIGCSTGGRASFSVRHLSGGRAAALTPMVGDFRVVRMSHDEGDLFTGEDLVQLIRYAEWIRVIVEDTFGRGHVLHVQDADPVEPEPLPS
ncbi:hypothetical protein [Actinomadura sp. NEAU-AAG7]|uniref:hypothetical protein n=1 Tax=Actinomadura sp. NEAU-AAG7 TaxID=2839640 RepID=UPI001BE4B580|nr:hypothetical protein [Actinomadura sp. NEAU-AAG7]MBT2212391.1 hypothetical protein [Actinomadura sp. NEAU-AAG7]